MTNAINIVSSTTHIIVDPAASAVTITRGGERGLTGSDGLDGADGAYIYEGTSPPGGMANGSFYYDTDDVPNVPAGLYASGVAACTASVTPLSTSNVDVTGCTTGSIVLQTGDIVRLVGSVDASSPASVAVICVLNINGALQSAQAVYKSTDGLERGLSSQTWEYVVPATGAYTFQLQARVASGSGGTINSQHTTLSWEVFRLPSPPAGVLYYKTQSGALVAIAGVGAQVPGGTDTQFQFNDVGGFEGTDKLVVNSGIVKFTDAFDHDVIAVPPSPSAGDIRQFASNLARRIPEQLVTTNAKGMVMPQAWRPRRYLEAFASGNSMLSSGLSTTAPALLGTGTLSYTGFNYALSGRTRYGSAVGPGASAGWTQFVARANANNIGGYFARGDAAGEGGFWMRARVSFNLAAVVNGDRYVLFIGMVPAASSYAGFGNAANMATQVNLVGLTADVTWTAGVANADWKTISNDGAGAAVIGAASGMLATYNEFLDFYMWCYPNDTEVHGRLENVLTGSGFSWTISSDLPAGNQGLMPTIYMDTYAATIPSIYFYDWRVEALGI